MGMGEMIAIDSHELEDFVCELLREMKIAQTKQLIICQETKLVQRTNDVRMIPTSVYRAGYAIKVCPCPK